jgi:hypothetical protein
MQNIKIKQHFLVEFTHNCPGSDAGPAGNPLWSVGPERTNALDKKEFE